MAGFFKKHWQVALFGLAFAAILYSMLMTQQLTNTFDGLWDQNYNLAGIHELTSGRWLLYYVDAVVMGLHADPVASFAALCLYVMGFLLVLDLFGVKNKIAGFLCMALFVSSTLICNTLSYRFTSLGYALAFLLAVAAIYAAIRVKNKYAAAPVAGVLLGLSLACYQAYISVFCLVAVFYFIFLCNAPEKKDENGKNPILCSFLRILCAMLIGSLFYIVTLTLFLNANNAALSDYTGVGGASLTEFISGIPDNIGKTYEQFSAYFQTDALKTSILQPYGVYYLLLALLAAVVIVIGIRSWKVCKVRLAVLPLAVAVIPVACNAFLLFAGNRLAMQMTAGLAMLAPLTLIAAFTCFENKRYLKIACAVFCALLIYGSSMQVWLDQEAMYEGRNACQSMATQVIDDLKEEDLLSTDYEYFFVGVPARNEFFSVSEAFADANGYAQMGNFWVSGHCNQMSYNGLISKYMGFNLPISYLLYEDLEPGSGISEMPVFPDEGYITLLRDSVVVVKISEHAEYSEYSLQQDVK